MMININDLLEYRAKGQIERVLWIDELGRLVYVIDVHAKDAWPELKTFNEIRAGIEIGEIAVGARDPYAVPVDEAALGEKHKRMREEAWRRIASLVAEEPAVYRREGRGPLVQQATEEYGVTHQTLYRHLRRYWQRGKTPNALLPDYGNSGAPGKERKAADRKRGRPRKYGNSRGVNVDPEMRKLFRVAIENYYLNKQEISFQAVYQMMIWKFFTEGVYYDAYGNAHERIRNEDALPTLAQFRYWYKKEFDSERALAARKGRKVYEKDYRAVLGCSTAETFGPGSRYQIDATIADVYLVSRYDRSKIVGRPVVYAVIDVFSRMVTGLYVGFEGPSWVSAMMALVSACVDKTAFCREYGIDIADTDWPCRGLPETILGNRGEMEAAAVETLINAFGIRVENTPPHRADWKGIVERRFRTIQTQFKPYAPGYIATDFRQRGTRDYRLDATLDIYEFTQLIIYCALYHNNSHWLSRYDKDEFLVTDDVPPIPVELWGWGIVNRTGKLRSYPEDIVKLNLLPAAPATVTGEGIRFKHCLYSCPRAIQEHWFERARRKSWKVRISYDPSNMDNVYLRDEAAPLEYAVCSLTDKSRLYRAKTLWEIEHLVQEERRKQALRQPELLQKKVDLDAVFENITAEAAAKTREQRTVGASQAERTRSIRANRQEAKEAARTHEAFDIADRSRGRQEALPVDADNTPAEDFSYPSMIDYLRHKRRAKKDDKK